MAQEELHALHAGAQGFPTGAEACRWASWRSPILCDLREASFFPSIAAYVQPTPAANHRPVYWWRLHEVIGWVPITYTTVSRY